MSELQLSLAIYALAAAISLAVAAVIKLVGAIGASRARRRAPRAPAAGPARAAAERAPPDEQEVAAISAAIHAMLGRHRIVHLAERTHGTAWAAEGRAAHHASHDVARHGHAAPVKPRH